MTNPKHQAAEKRLDGRRHTVVTFLVVAICTLLFAELLARVVVGPRTGDANATKEVQTERQIGLIRSLAPDGVDIVVAGTSMAGVGVDPAVLSEISGRSAFNAALGCANPLVVADWVPNFVAPELTPDVVVLAITPSDLDARSCPRSWTEIEMLTVSAEDDWSLRRAVDPRPFLRENSVLWRHRPWLRQINNLPYLVMDVPWTWDVTFRSDGFWQIDAWAEVDQQTFILEPHRTQISIDQSRIDAIASTVSELKSQGVNVVIAEMPMAQRWLDHIGDSVVSYADAEQALRDVANDIGARYLPSPDEFHDNLLFIDEGHMTPEGADLYSRWLGVQLANF